MTSVIPAPANHERVLVSDLGSDTRGTDLKTALSATSASLGVVLMVSDRRSDTNVQRAQCGAFAHNAQLWQSHNPAAQHAGRPHEHDPMGARRMPHDDTTPKTITLSRRETVLGAFAVGSAATLTFGAPDVSAKAPMARSQRQR